MRSMGENLRKDVSDISKSFPSLNDEFAIPAFLPKHVGDSSTHSFKDNFGHNFIKYH